MKTKKKYLVSYRVVGEQLVEVEAHSKKEAKEKTKSHDGDAWNFTVLYNLWSTMKAEEIKK